MFGGAMACLADPIAALACSRAFPGYKVWTRALTLDFEREGRTDMELRFLFEPGTEGNIRDQLRQRGRSTPTFEIRLFRHKWPALRNRALSGGDTIGWLATDRKEAE